MNVKSAKITDIGYAIKIYYQYPEIGNKEISKLFGVVSGQALCRIKKEVREEMIKENIPYWNGHAVNTRTAYRVWGIDIDELERNYTKLKKLGLLSKEEGQA